MKIQNKLNYIGIISFISAIIALIIPLILFIAKPFTTTETINIAVFILYNKVIFYIFAAFGFVTGIIGRKTKLGKTGLLIAAISLGYMICHWILLGCIFFYMEITDQSWF
jgi:hypothetical protein